jgi:hypothetical protein
MSRSYEILFAVDAIPHDETLVKTSQIRRCVICTIETSFKDTALGDSYICCEDCRVLLWQRLMKQERSGHFKSYTFILTNGTKKEFTEVRAWFTASDQGSFLYLEQLDVEGKPKSRWDLGDMRDILTGERLPDL